MKIRVPNYYKNFKCIGAECTDTCCAGWEVVIDDKSYKYYKKVPGDFGQRLKATMIATNENSFVLQNGNCPFLNEMKLCDIYTELGKDKFTVVAVCNGQYYGGGYQMAPDASLTDNNFDIYYIDKIKKLEMPNLLMKVKNGVHEQLKIVHKVLSDRIIIQSANDIICNIDGETLINKKFEIQLIKEGVTLFNDKNLVDRILQK